MPVLFIDTLLKRVLNNSKFNEKRSLYPIRITNLLNPLRQKLNRERRRGSKIFIKRILNHSIIFPISSINHVICHSVNYLLLASFT